MTSLSSWRRAVATTLLTTTLVVGSIAAPAVAADNPYQRGPEPSRSSIEAAARRVRHHVDVGRPGTVVTVSAAAPSTTRPTSQGTFGAVAISPGYTARQSSIAWLGPRLASQGFVVITIDTNDRLRPAGLARRPSCSPPSTT